MGKTAPRRNSGGRGRWRLAMASLALAVACFGLPAAGRDARAAPPSLRWLPAVDLRGPTIGLDAWYLGEGWVTYAGGAWQLGTEGGSGARGRAGITLGVNPADAFDVRLSAWPSDRVPGWDGDAGLQMTYQHLPAEGPRWSLAGQVGYLFDARALAWQGLEPTAGTVSVQYLHGELVWPMAAAGGFLQLTPGLRLVAGRESGAGDQSFGAATLTLPIESRGWLVEALVGGALPPSHGLSPRGGSPGRPRLGFRLGGLPNAEVLLRGAPPPDPTLDPERLGYRLTIERRFELPPVPANWPLWPGAAAWLMLYVDAGGVGDALRGAGTWQTDMAFGVGVALAGPAGRVEAFTGLHEEGGTNVLRAGMRWVPLVH